MPSAVVRFCRSVGLDGLSQLKQRLAEELGGQSDNEIPTAIQDDGSPETVFRKVFRSGIRTLEDTLQMIPAECINSVCSAFRSAKRLVFFGVGTSSVIAVDAAYRFAQFGLNATSCTDVVFMGVTAIHLGRGDVAVGISHSGATKATVDALRLAKEAGATTVALTSFADSLLAQECALRITVFSDERNYPVEAVSAQVAHICVIDALSMAVASEDPNTIPAHIAGRNRILGQIRYGKESNKK